MDNNKHGEGDSLRRKQEYFAELENATKSDDDETTDHGRTASQHAVQRAAVRKQQLAKTFLQNTNALPRSISDTNLVEKPTKPTVMGMQPQSLHPTSSEGENKLPATLITRHTFSGSSTTRIKDANAAPSSSALPKTTGKRKRATTTINNLPPSQQIFHSLTFFFFPNTDTNPARKMRITKAQQYGATWTKDFANDDASNITHIIVDKAIDFTQMLKFLKIDAVPKGVVVVSENYPAECIAFRRVLDPLQLQFRVRGFDMPAAGGRPESSGSEGSLLLKPAGDAVRARRAETPVGESVVGTLSVEVPLDKWGSGDPASTDVPQDNPAAPQEIESTPELDAAILRARSLQHLPFDPDDDESRPSSSSGPASDSDSSSQQQQQQHTTFPHPHPNSKTRKHQPPASKYQCMHKHTATTAPTHPNAPIITTLQQMADHYAQTGDPWRPRAYRQAISALRNHPTPIRTKDDALALPRIGERLATKIEEIALTSRLRRLDSVRAEPGDKALRLFMGVYGAGIKVAGRWVAAGYTSLEEVRREVDLTPAQKVGIEHYGDFNSRIPRAEVAQHGEIVRQALRRIDPGFELVVGGSYRRGADTIGDIDFVITKSGGGTLGEIRQVVLARLVPELFARGFLVAELAATSGGSGSKWHGASQLPAPASASSGGSGGGGDFGGSSGGDGTSNPNPWRRIDFLLVPEAEMGAAMIYFTGNDIFNRSLRYKAGKMGMRLNQRGLYRDVLRGKGREKLSEGVLVEARSERRILEVLGVPWRPPEHRNC